MRRNVLATQWVDVLDTILAFTQTGNTHLADAVLIVRAAWVRRREVRKNAWGARSVQVADALRILGHSRKRATRFTVDATAVVGAANATRRGDAGAAAAALGIAAARKGPVSTAHLVIIAAVFGDAGLTVGATAFVARARTVRFRFTLRRRLSALARIHFARPCAKVSIYTSRTNVRMLVVSSRSAQPVARTPTT